MNLFKLFAREKVVNFGSASVRIDPPPAVIGIPCDACGSFYQQDKLLVHYTLEIRTGKKRSEGGCLDEPEIKGVSLHRPLYCEDCSSQTEIQLVLQKEGREIETRNFAILAYGVIQEIDENSDDEDFPELFPVAYEQYARGICSDCEGNNAQQDTCSSCRRKSK